MDKLNHSVLPQASGLAAVPCAFQLDNVQSVVRLVCAHCCLQQSGCMCVRGGEREKDSSFAAAVGMT